MRQILAVGIPVIGKFVLWALFTKLPVHSMIIFALVVLVGILMIYSLSHFARGGSQQGSSS
jgi:hypothetical protein